MTKSELFISLLNDAQVGISFSYLAGSYCFLCSHFAAGQTQVDVTV